MKDYLKSIVNKKVSAEDNLNRVREYIQAYFLYIIYRKKYYQDMVFTGGTALRFVHHIRRFSEDIDFSLSGRAKQIDFTGMMQDIAHEFKQAGYAMEMKIKTRLAVQSALLKFSDIMFETGLSLLKDEKFLIKVEIDSRPPAGGVEAHSMVTTPFMFYMLHYDLPSLLAGKTHALLCREYTKGRDWYDLLWYLGKFKELEPNFTMLNNAMAQTEKDPILLTSRNWKAELKKAVQKADFAKVKLDVGRFLEDQTDLELLNLEAFVNLLELKRGVTQGDSVVQ
ncbi:MAG: nucleotidyl transferase AbiEii/AbiGii toxin family protein [Candidatus Omnitrophica bacterium]|nr:nucleotidyl transferase AbiEii/AbiGii toxin family protein [Candidatus Omnitrophota bacterium]